jgi:hypothetical protein
MQAEDRLKNLEHINFAVDSGKLQKPIVVDYPSRSDSSSPQRREAEATNEGPNITTMNPITQMKSRISIPSRQKLIESGVTAYIGARGVKH